MPRSAELCERSAAEEREHREDAAVLLRDGSGRCEEGFGNNAYDIGGR